MLHIHIPSVIGADPDLPVKPTGDMRRVMSRQSWLPMYQFQHIYLLVLYGLLAIKFRIQDVTDTFMGEWDVETCLGAACVRGMMRIVNASLMCISMHPLQLQTVATAQSV